MKSRTNNIRAVQDTVKDFYVQHKRDLPWRQPEPNGSQDPYKILVSEVMLQQTQVSRVIPKYTEFLQLFPSIDTLASAPLGAVLRVWSGLGYNRRAKFLHQTARILTACPQPWTYADLIKCPGLGPNTAAAILVYAYNQSYAFIETNIRTVCIHHFFQDQEDVTDSQISEVLNQLFDTQNAREFAWALMDYGTHLKRTAGNASRLSRHYVTQKPFQGSYRQLRGKVIQALSERAQSTSSLAHNVKDTRLKQVLADLCQEELVVKKGSVYSLP